MNMAPTLKSSAGKGGNYGPEMPMTPILAATLSKGSAASPGVNPPGRRQEDDVNLVPTLAGTLMRHGQGSADHEMETLLPVATSFHMTQEPIHGEEFTPALGRTSIGMGLQNTAGVRRLTPRECERLQGFPDDWTLIPGLKCPDSRRYAAMGNAVTINVAEWIGRRIQALEANA